MEVSEVTLRKYTPIPWLGTAFVAAIAIVAAASAGLVEASAFLPALAVVAAIDYRRSR
jgi:hypothetical protein